MVDSQNRGPQYGPQNIIILIIGTPNKVPRILGSSGVKQIRGHSRHDASCGVVAFGEYAIQTFGEGIRRTMIDTSDIGQRLPQDTCKTRDGFPASHSCSSLLNITV